MEEMSREIITARYLCFQVDDSLYGLKTEYITEVIQSREITPIPKSPPYVAGIINQRGRIAPVIDLRAKFNLQRSKSFGKILIINYHDSCYGLLVDAVTQITDIDIAEIKDVNLLMPRENSGLYEGISRIGSEIIGLIAIDDLFGGPVVQVAASPFFVKNVECHKAAAVAREVEKIYFILEVSDEQYGIESTWIEEIIEAEPAVKMAQMPEHIIGFIKRRRRMIPVVDLKRRFGLENGDHNGRHVAVVRHGNYLFGLLADKACELVRIPESCIKKTPDLIMAGNADYIVAVAVAAQHHKAILLIDAGKILTNTHIEAGAFAEMSKSKSPWW